MTRPNPAPEPEQVYADELAAYRRALAHAAARLAREEQEDGPAPKHPDPR